MPLFYGGAIILKFWDLFPNSRSIFDQVFGLNVIKLVVFEFLGFVINDMYIYQETMKIYNSQLFNEIIFQKYIRTLLKY